MPGDCPAPANQALQVLKHVFNKRAGRIRFLHQIGDIRFGQRALGTGNLAADEGRAHMVDIHIARLQQGRIGREHDVRAGHFRCRVAEEQFDAVLPRERKLRLNVLAGTGVFRFL